jgi:alginate O-acetyltransferase complex protein AlgI
MFSFGDWSLSEQSRASLTGLQVGTLVVAYVVLAVFGLRQFYNQPLQSKAPKAAAKTDEVAADGPASAQPRSPQDAENDPAAIAYSRSGAAVYRPHWLTQLPVLATRVALLALFAASVLKLSAQSYSPFLYFQF